MDKSLINKNQCIYFGIPTCDNLPDNKREIQFVTDNILIPISMDRSIDTMATCIHTNQDLGTCSYITMLENIYINYYPWKSIWYHKIPQRICR